MWMHRALVTLIVVASAPLLAGAGAFEQALRKLDPEERAHQACIIKGLETVRRDARLRGADRMKTSIFGRAVLEGTRLTAKGGAVRVKQHWYAISFTCTLVPDYMKATSFVFELGAEVPKARWDEYGLWG
jgi:hypothetical protein